MVSNESSSMVRVASAGRYQPVGGAGRRTRRLASSTPRRSKTRPIVRTDGSA